MHQKLLRKHNNYSYIFINPFFINHLSMASSLHTLNLMSLPHDVIRAIIKAGQEYIDGMRLVNFHVSLTCFFVILWFAIVTLLEALDLHTWRKKIISEKMIFR